MIKIEKLKLSQVKVNAANPRTITRDKFQKLINSLLVFPKMLEIRPVVLDAKRAALGGNMRLQALKEIAKMDVEGIALRLSQQPEYVKGTEGERQTMVRFWGTWLEQPFVFTIDGRHLTEAERRQFIIKDNVSYGQWDYDKLANTFDNDRLEGWGLDVWTTPPVDFPGAASQPTPPAAPQQDVDDFPQPTSGNGAGAGAASDNDFGGALPPELQGRDLTPNVLPKSDISQDTACDYLTIVYHPGEKQSIADYLGVSANTLFSRVCWKLDDLKTLMQNEDE